MQKLQSKKKLILNKIINEWDTFVGLIKLEHITKELLRLCKIEKIENDFTKLKIVCDSKLSYGRISSNENKIKIKEATKEKYNIEIDYYVETKDIIENENTIYATKEDFDQIDFPIETE
ncbi:MAG: hypothetical protein Q4F88_06805 [Eubacteriales bacterium]|nr:hypothetical protein [Eubacteriales bacterium]